MITSLSQDCFSFQSYALCSCCIDIPPYFSLNMQSMNITFVMSKFLKGFTLPVAIFASIVSTFLLSYKLEGVLDINGAGRTMARQTLTPVIRLSFMKGNQSI